MSKWFLFKRRSEYKIKKWFNTPPTNAEQKVNIYIPLLITIGTVVIGIATCNQAIKVDKMTNLIDSMHRSILIQEEINKKLLSLGEKSDQTNKNLEIAIAKNNKQIELLASSFELNKAISKPYFSIVDSFQFITTSDTTMRVIIPVANVGGRQAVKISYELLASKYFSNLSIDGFSWGTFRDDNFDLYSKEVKTITFKLSAKDHSIPRKYYYILRINYTDQLTQKKHTQFIIKKSELDEDGFSYQYNVAEYYKKKIISEYEKLERVNKMAFMLEEAYSIPPELIKKRKKAPK